MLAGTLLSSRSCLSNQDRRLCLAVVGCGRAAVHYAETLQSYPHLQLTAAYDLVPERAQAFAARFGGRTCDSLDDLLADDSIEVVVNLTDPASHHYVTAQSLAAGKHVFLAKPVAVDVWGCKSILASGEQAKGRVSFLVDFQFRAAPVARECVARVHRGDIGVPVVAHVYYHTGRLRPKSLPGDTPESARLRNWVFDKALSGDIIVEQNIHALDCGCWFLNTRPEKAWGTGGRKVRVDVGDCWDHFAVTYSFPGGVIADFSSTQCIKGYNDICARIYGSEGTAEAHYGGAVRITGDKPFEGTEKANIGRDGVYANIRTFAERVKSGQHVNNAAESVGSNLTAILGRMAAYQNRTVTWDEMMRSDEKLDLRLPRVA